MRSLMFCDFLNPDAVRQPVTFMGDTLKYPLSFSQVIVFVIYLFILFFLQIGDDRLYQEVESIEELYKIVENCLEEYNQTHKTQMNLVIFRYLC